MSKKCTSLWREAHFQVQVYKTHEHRTTFGSWDVAKSARRCGAKHISKSKCTKHFNVGPLLQVEMSQKCTPLWREAHFQVQMYKTFQRRTAFGSWDFEKVHAIVARSTFPSQNVQSTSTSDHFWKLRCRKSARRFGAKHISRSNVLKTEGPRTTFASWDVEKVHVVVARSTFPSPSVQSTSTSDHFWKLRCRKCARRCGAKHIVQMYKTHQRRTTFGSWDFENVHVIVARSTFPSPNVQSTPTSDQFWKLRCCKKCTPLWHDLRFQVKMYKTDQRRTTFGSWDVEKVHAIVARSTFPSQNVQSTSTSDHFWKLRCCKKCTPLWREAHFQVKMYKTHQRQTTFGSWDVEKVHVVVARSTFPSPNVQNISTSDHFCKLRCRKSARHCGAKHIYKSKCTKHINVGPLLEVKMLKKCTPLWREANFQVKRVTKLTLASDHFWKFSMSKKCTPCQKCAKQCFVAVSTSSANYNTAAAFGLHYTPRSDARLAWQAHYAIVHSCPLQSTTLNVKVLLAVSTTTTTTLVTATLHYIKRYTTLHCTTLHYTTLHDTTL